MPKYSQTKGNLTITLRCPECHSEDLEIQDDNCFKEFECRLCGNYFEMTEYDLEILYEEEEEKLNNKELRSLFIRTL